jgi:WD40 repeat protein
MQTGASQGSIRAEYARPSDPEDRIIPGRIKLCLAPDGEHLATVNTASGAQGPIRVWHLPTEKLLWQEPVKERFPPEVGFTRDGLLVMEGAQPVLKDTQTGQVLHRYPAGISERLPVISPRGDLMAYETRSGETAILQLPEGTILDRCSGAPLRFTPTGKALAVAPDTYSIRHRDWQTRTDTRGVFLDREGPVMILSPDATLVAITTDEGHFPIHDARTGQLLAVCESPQHGDGILLPECDQIQFSPDGRTLVACYRNGVIRAWESLTGHLLGEYEQESGELKTAAFSPDGRRFLTNAWGGRVSGTIIGWDLTMGATQSLHRPDPGEWQYLIHDLRGEARRARWAIDRVARDQERTLAWIDALRKDPRPEELKRYRLALEELDARQYTTREGAFALLWEAGWRVERELRAALEQSPSQHLRVEITRLLDHPDPRPTRIVHLLELIGSPEAMRRIQELAADPRDLPFQREARRVRLARFPKP